MHTHQGQACVPTRSWSLHFAHMGRRSRGDKPVKLLVGLVWPWRAHDSLPLSGYVGVTPVPLVPYLAQRHGEERSEVVQRTKSVSSASRDLGLLSGQSCSPELEDACFVTFDTFEETGSC